MRGKTLTLSKDDFAVGEEFTVYGGSDFVINEFSVTTNATPVPAALPLAAAGLGLVHVRRRRRVNAESAEVTTE